MAPAASTLSVTAAASKRPAASDEAELPLDSSLSLHQQQGDEAARKGQGCQQQLDCPRCRSTNTKFCYYNNYSTAQPRHFCRACRRYWTHGGTLRDVPVGGASRRAGGGGKRRRVSSAETSSSLADACLSDLPSAFPFLSDGSFFPQLDRGGVALAPPAFSSSWRSVVPDLYDGLAPWGDGAAAGAAATGAWGDFAGLDLGWTPPAGELSASRSPS